MTPQAKKILDDALLLPPTEREAMAIQLFDSLPSDEGVDLHEELADQELDAELARRISELESGAVKAIIRNTLSQGFALSLPAHLSPNR